MGRVAIYGAQAGNWVSGSMDYLTFDAKVYTEPSGFGIPTPRFPDGGNISKLSVFNRYGDEVYAYDRGTSIEAAGNVAQDVAEIVAALEAAFAE